MRRILAVAAGLAAGALALTACSGADDVPEADQTLPDAAEAMAEVENVRFTLDTDGEVKGLDITSADGVVTADGESEGTGIITAMGTDVEIEHVIVGESAHVKGLTGGYQEIPVGDDMLPYNPTVLLDPEHGVAGLLEAYDSAEAQDTETVDGVDAYRYEVEFDPEVFADFIPAQGEWHTATVWFDQDTSRVVKAAFEQDGATVTLTLGDYDDDSVDIAVP